jgi:predicted O-linked N-acetylglucosamine transferase (SPINDLY family)
LALAEFVPDVGEAWHVAARRRWALSHAEPLTAAAPRPSAGPLEGRRLRLGLVSADFGQHPTGYFLAGVLPHCDRTRLQIICYSDRLQDDPLTERIRAASEIWRETARLDDAALADLIRVDAIDVLVDLAGHGFGNRLLSFARRPAMTQASWIGAIEASGIAAIDWLISDAGEWPLGREAPGSGRVLRLPTGRLCYQPPETAPVPAAPGSRPPVFGCFAKAARLNPGVVALWARLLARVPDACLLLKWSSFEDAEIRRACLSAFGSHGIGEDRLTLSGWSPHAQLLGAYGGIDVALDPFPFGGALTSCEALWMGVPVITLEGARPAHRQTAALLKRLGLDSLIADSEGDYVERACALVADRTWRHELGRTLRDRMRRTICDGEAAGRALSAAVWAMVRAAPRAGSGLQADRG